MRVHFRTVFLRIVQIYFIRINVNINRLGWTIFNAGKKVTKKTIRMKTRTKFKTKIIIIRIIIEKILRSLFE